MLLYEEIEKSFPKLEKLFISPESLSEFRNTPISKLNIYHFSLGLWIRNNLLYSDESNLYNLFLENGIIHQDDMSTIMIQLFHYRIS